MDSPDFMRLLNFLQLLILCGFFPTAPGFDLVSTTRLIQIRSGSNFILTFERFACISSPGFVRLLSYSSWFCLASTTHEAERNIEFHSYCSAVCMDYLLFCMASFPHLLVLYGFFPTAPGFVWLPQLRDNHH